MGPDYLRLGLRGETMHAMRSPASPVPQVPVLLALLLMPLPLVSKAVVDCQCSGVSE